MKEYIKRILIVLVGIIVGSGLTYVLALSGVDVIYDNSNSTLEATTVQGALDELYEKSESCGPKSNIVAAYTYNSTSCITGEESGCVQTECYKTKTAGSCPAGTIIKYKVNDTEEKYFHVLHDDGEKITMQQRENTIANTAWYSSEDNSQGPTTVLPVLENATSGWTNVNDLEYTLGTDTLYKNKYTGCSSYSSCSTNTYTLAKRSNKKARMITIQETNALGCTTNTQSCPNWMNNYLYNSTTYGGTVNNKTDANGKNIYGYWTMSANSSFSNYAWYVFSDGHPGNGGRTTSTNNGARAVVEISK